MMKLMKLFETCELQGASVEKPDSGGSGMAQNNYSRLVTTGQNEPKKMAIPTSAHCQEVRALVHLISCNNDAVKVLPFLLLQCFMSLLCKISSLWLAERMQVKNILRHGTTNCIFHISGFASRCWVAELWIILNMLKTLPCHLPLVSWSTRNSIRSKIFRHPTHTIWLMCDRLNVVLD